MVHVPDVPQGVSEVVERLAAATDDLEPPFAALDLATLDANAESLLRRADGLPVRVASKSVRCRAVLDRVFGTETADDARFRGIMAFSLREAIWLAGAGASDVLMGYPTVDTAALRTLVEAGLTEHITLMVDDPAQLEIARIACGPSAQIRVCLDVDASLRIGPLHLGARRSPLRTPQQAADLARAAREAGFRVVGVMTYEAQIAGVPDSSLPVVLMKKASARELAVRRPAVVAAVQKVTGDLEIVNSGGTGSIEVSIADPTVTEVTAGSGFYMPALFDSYRSFVPHPAMFFATSALRKPARRITTVFAGGYPASGASGRSRLPKPMWPDGLRLSGSEGAGEVQTPVYGESAARLRIGDRVWFRHAKAGELCERFNEVHLVTPDGSRTTVPTYRGEGMCFG